jgi:hypothetical protein
MNSKLLQLNFSQLESAWKKTKNNHYSDSKKNRYQNKLNDLFNKLNAEDFSKLTADETLERSLVIDFFFYSITFLNGSTITQIPFEIIKCLEEALGDWVDEKEDFIIVTSLVKGISDFSFDFTLTFRDEFYEIIERNFDVKFESKLIQINLPESLTGDYLANVVLYHELGHFIDRRYRISELLTTILISLEKNGLLKPDLLKVLLKFFPVLEKTNINNNTQLLYAHFSEYFCDLFAAQYVEGTLGSYLKYLTKESDDWHLTHPSTGSRVELVDDFLNKNSNVFLDFILEVVSKASKRELKVRFKKFSTTDFENLIPVEIDSSGELHYLFVYGWNLWLSDWSEFEKINNMDYSLSATQVYEIINNLIEKSIGNFIIKANWKKHKNVPTI